MTCKNPKLFVLPDNPPDIVTPACTNAWESNPVKLDMIATNIIKNKKSMVLSYPKRITQRLPADSIVIIIKINSMLLIELITGTSDQKFVDRIHMRYNVNNTSQLLLI